MARMRLIVLAAVVGVLLCALTAMALSVTLPAPEIRYPEGFDKAKAATVAKVLTDKQFKYVDGLYSHWPPAWSTTLVYAGDAKRLGAMVATLSRVEGMSTRVTFSKDLAKESGTGHSVGDWWIMYSHETPQTITVRVNMASIDVSQVELILPSR